MRNRLSKTVICLSLTSIGVASVLFCSSRYEQLGNVASTIFGVLGISLAIIPFIIAISSSMAAVGYARLRAGKGLIARWHIAAKEWHRFRAFDAIRAAQDLALRSRLFPECAAR